MAEASASSLVPSCSICAYDYDTVQRRPKVLPSCGHSFCEQCIRSLVGKRCPLGCHFVVPRETIVNWELLKSIPSPSLEKAPQRVQQAQAALGSTPGCTIVQMPVPSSEEEERIGRIVRESRECNTRGRYQDAIQLLLPLRYSPMSVHHKLWVQIGLMLAYKRKGQDEVVQDIRQETVWPEDWISNELEEQILDLLIGLGEVYPVIEQCIRIRNHPLESPRLHMKAMWALYEHRLNADEDQQESAVTELDAIRRCPGHLEETRDYAANMLIKYYLKKSSDPQMASKAIGILVAWLDRPGLSMVQRIDLQLCLAESYISIGKHPGPVLEEVRQNREATARQEERAQALRDKWARR